MRLPPDNPVYEVLFIDEPEKMHLTIPAGHVDAGELVVNGVAREALEETGLHLDMEKVKLCHLRNATGLGNGSQNHVDFIFFTIVPYDININVDGKEVLNHVWISVDNLEGTYFDKQISPLYKRMIRSDQEIGSPYISSPESRGRKSLIAVNKIPTKKETTTSSKAKSSPSSVSMCLDELKAFEIENADSSTIPLSVSAQFKDFTLMPMGMRRSISDGYFTPNATPKINTFLKMALQSGINPRVN
ncbi:MAG: hypothetical protein C0432_00875 [Candidatus Puniceispirillum sp.]|nr:hypothetical protein [Candidatus Pelagibacter sp.]MBA4282835.1 hypothetical protein [Candidatus Puniceispirillum sp.]